MKKIFSFLISLLISSSLILPDVAFAIQNVGFIPGGNSGSGGGGDQQCVQLGGTVAQNSKSFCCLGLKLDSQNVCINDTSPSDDSLVECNPNGPNTCGPGKGCLKQTSDSFFKYAPKTAQEDSQLDAQMDSIDNDAGGSEDGAPLAKGKTCQLNKDCESYHCVDKNSNGNYTCEDKFICRTGEEKDTNLTADIQCEEGLVKHSGICKIPYTPLGPYTGILDPNKISYEPLNRCSDEMDEDSSQKGLEAIRNFRALEWISTNFNAPNDCMYMNDFLRQEIATLFNNERKEILKQFNVMMAPIEMDQQVLMAAVEDKNIQLKMEGRTISSYDLATRRESGYDMMRVMTRKNEAYIWYESKMKQLAQKVADKLHTLSTDIGGWTDHNKKSYFILGSEKSWKTRACRGGGILDLGRRRIFKRWNSKWYIPASEENTKLVSTKNVLSELKLITDESETDISNKLFKSPAFSFFGNDWLKGTYLLDPLIQIPNASLLSQFLGSSVSTSLGSMSVLPALQLQGLASTIVSSIPNLKFQNTKDMVRLDYIAYLKELKTDLENANLTDPAMKIFIDKHLSGDKERLKMPLGFIYEPELVTLQTRTCLEKDGPLCGEFNDHTQMISDYVLAAHLAWSRHSTNNYKNYFNNGDTWRRKLLQHWKEQIVNAGIYYDKKIELRQKQNNCLGQALFQVENQFLDHSGNGISEGGNNYYQGNTHSIIGGPTTPKNNKSPTSSKPISGKYNFALTLESFKNIGSSVTRDSLTRALSSVSSASMSEVDSALAARVKEMNDHNEKLAAKGVKVAEKEKEHRAILASMANSSGISKNAMASASNGAGSLGMDAFSTGVSSKKRDEEKAKDGLGEGFVDRSSTATSAGQKAGAFGSNYGIGGGVANESNTYQDPTKMSDEEKDIVLQNIERNKSKYTRNEDDDLFTIISKQYANSLPRILTRKRASEE